MSKSAGFSLIEAMVALVVISVGMIGIAALYTQGLAASRVALSRTAAVNLVSRMAEDIRVNPLGQGAYNGGPPGTNNHCDPSTGGGVACTPDQMAGHDLFLWNNEIQQVLGANATGTVAFAAGTPPTYTITVAWREAGVAPDPTETITIQVPTN